MIVETPAEKRQVKHVQLNSDLTVVGGGLAGTCCAITAARRGMKVVLVQDRPVLGGNSSSEVRLWVLGATSHMGNNNRWAREGGLINEILIENAFRNVESNPLIFDTILLEKVHEEKNITLLLNTAVYDLEKKDQDQIRSIEAFCSQNSTRYTIGSPLFCDASGDGIVGFLAGAAFRMGAESKQEFGEKFAPESEYGELLGHSIYFYTKDTGRPVRFMPPKYALTDITKIPRYRKFSAKDQGCNLWWLEYGGRLDTIHDTEQIKFELWKVVYGVWNYIKNSGEFPEAETMTLEWVGTIPGKRESRRFEGDYILRQQDIVEQRFFDDTVAFGGWSIDLHPADGVFSEKPGCNQWHSKGIYGIPYRSYYSRNISNLFLAGRIISATHVAFGSSRVMGTCAHGGQAVGMAAALCKDYGLSPARLGAEHITDLQRELLKTGQHLPGLKLDDPADLVQQASSISGAELALDEIRGSGLWKAIGNSCAQMLPMQAGSMPGLSLRLRATKATTLEVQFRKSSKPFNHTPDVILNSRSFELKAGQHELRFDFNETLDTDCYVFLCFMKNPDIELEFSEERITGLVSVFNSINPAVSNYGKQEPTEDIGVDAFEFWCPQRRPNGQNIAMRIDPPLKGFSPENVRNGIQRPVSSVNAWVAPKNAQHAHLSIKWDEPRRISELVLSFDCDYDNPMENVLFRQPDAIQPFCVTDVTVFADGKQVAVLNDNHQAQASIRFSEPVNATELQIRAENRASKAPVALFEVRAY